MNAPTHLREVMPETAAWIDALRAAFGAESINAAIKAGMNGVPLFWASENEHEVGTRDTEPKNTISGTQMVIHTETETKEPHENRKRRHR